MKINEITKKEWEDAFKNAAKTTAKKTISKADFLKNSTATWVGPESGVWNDVTSFEAQRLEKEGWSERMIWKMTQNIRGTDGNWMQEISDHNAKLKPEGVDPRDGIKTLGDHLDHEELFKAYPHAKDIKVKYWDNKHKPQTTGRYNEYRDEISVGIYGQDANGKTVKRTPSQLISTMAHEWQHGNETLEKWAPGGSSTTDTTKEIAKNLTKAGQPHDAYDTYRSLGGEVNTRSTVDRLDLTPDQRKAQHPTLGRLSKTITIPGHTLPPHITDPNAVSTTTSRDKKFITYTNPDYGRRVVPHPLGKSSSKSSDAFTKVDLGPQKAISVDLTKNSANKTKKPQ